MLRCCVRVVCARVLVCFYLLLTNQTIDPYIRSVHILLHVVPTNVCILDTVICRLVRVIFVGV